VLDRPLAELPRDIPRPKAEEFFTSDGLYIYKLGKIAPRAYFASEVKPADNDDVLDEHVLPDFDPASEVLIDQSSLADLHGGPYVSGAGQERVQTASLDETQGAGQPARRVLSDARVAAHTAIMQYADNFVEIDVDAPRAGIVVLHDLFYPGWEARVDGHEVTILRANILFRGVEVPAGHHRIEFSFHPLSLTNLAAAASTVLHRQED
jgi:hypothetical protein